MHGTKRGLETLTHASSTDGAGVRYPVHGPLVSCAGVYCLVDDFQISCAGRHGMVFLTNGGRTEVRGGDACGVPRRSGENS